MRDDRGDEVDGEAGVGPFFEAPGNHRDEQRGNAAEDDRQRHAGAVEQTLRDEGAEAGEKADDLGGGLAEERELIGMVVACAAAFVAAYTPFRSLTLAIGSSPVVSSRSFSRACTRPLICCPSAASWDTWPNSSALSAADATRRPPKTRPMSRASTITAISRVDTGQFRRVSALGLVYREVVASPAFWLAVPARGPALATLWFPIADVLAGYALSVNCRTADPRRPAASRCKRMWDAATVVGQRAKYPANAHLVT